MIQNHTGKPAGARQLSMLLGGAVFVACLGLGFNRAVAVNAAARPSWDGHPVISVADDGSEPQRRRKPREIWSGCLPTGIRSTDLVANDEKGPKTTHVGTALTALHARCSTGKLVGGDGREIRFHSLLCWGNPPADADEQVAAEKREIADLQTKYTVILLRCDPRTK
jgi:hypothetical protein